jgi:sugar O-acyltransferase (sialic acid O-acetyltransferase NeuD family)
MKSLKPLVIIGAGEIAAMADQYFTYDSDRTVTAFAIGSEYISTETYLGRPLVPLDELETKYPPSEFDAFVAIGDAQLNRVRKGHYEDLKARGYVLASYVSSKAFVWRDIPIGDNCFILEHNVLQPFVTIGNNVTLWSGNHIGHRAVIEDHVFIASHVVISGYVSIGACSFVGVNAAFAHQTQVAPDNFIAMGAVVSASTQPDGIYQGNPAELRKISAKRFCRVRE